MYGAVNLFIGKMAGSSIGILSGYMLLWAGYLNQESISDNVLFRMRLMYLAVPASLGLIGFIITLFFPLTRAKVMEVHAEIGRRRLAQAPSQID